MLESGGSQGTVQLDINRFPGSTQRERPTLPASLLENLQLKKESIIPAEIVEAA